MVVFIIYNGGFLDMKYKYVSPVVIKRLPRYYRYLDDMLQKNITRISSTELSKKMGVTASQIRQDLNCFGGFGQQGYGYNVEFLHDKIGDILGINRGYKMIIVGAGNLGHALANHGNFIKRGFHLTGIYDTNKDIIGTTISNIVVEDYKNIVESVKEKKPDIAILAVPKSAVNQVAQTLIQCGVKGFMNFTYAELDVGSDVVVENVHISDTLMTIAYKLTEENNIL